MAAIRGGKDTTRMGADEVAEMLAASPPSPRSGTSATPHSPLVSPRIEAAHAAVTAFDRDMQAAPDLTAKLDVIRMQVRSLLVAFEMLKSSLTYEDDKSKATLDALEEKLVGIARDVADLQREFAEHRTVLVATAGRQVETQQMAKEALDDAAQSEQRISRLAVTVAEAQSDLAEVEAEVVVLASEARPRLDSVRDLDKRVSDGEQRDAAIQIKADAAAAEAAAARAEGEKTAGEVRSLRGWNVALLGFRASVLVGTYEFVKHYALDLLKALLGGN